MSAFLLQWVKLDPAEIISAPSDGRRDNRTVGTRGQRGRAPGPQSHRLFPRCAGSGTDPVSSKMSNQSCSLMVIVIQHAAKTLSSADLSAGQLDFKARLDNLSCEPLMVSLA